MTMLDNGKGSPMQNPREFAESKYHQVEDCDPISEEIKGRVRQVICERAEGETLAEQVIEAEEFMKMLGVHPSQNDDEEYRVGVSNLPNPSSQRSVIPTTPPRILS